MQQFLGTEEPKAKKKPKKSPRNKKPFHVSEQSEVETVEGLPELFQFDLNLDSLRSFLLSLKRQVLVQKDQIEEINTNLGLKSNERTLSQYVQRISQAVHKDCGERPHKFKLDDPAFMTNEFNTVDGPLLKAASENLIEKLEIISNNVVSYRKFKSKTDKRLTAAENLLKNTVSKTEFRKEM